MSKPINTYLITPPEKPTQSRPEGIRYDLNDGVCVLLPEGERHVRLMGADSGNILFSYDANNDRVRSCKRYFTRFHIQVFHRGDDTPSVGEALNPRSQPVLISFPTDTLDDLLGWFPYAERFQALHKYQLECTMAQEIVELLAPQYP